jgi:hypothetical protein
MTDEARREAEDVFERYNSGIAESTAIYENGVLECDSPLYHFEITRDYVKAFDKKQEGKEVFYCTRSYSKIYQDQALLDGLRAITHMLPELNASLLETIVSHSIGIVQSGILNENSSLNSTFDSS